MIDHDTLLPPIQAINTAALERRPPVGDRLAPQARGSVLGRALTQQHTQRHETRLPAGPSVEADARALVDELAPQFARAAQLTGLVGSIEAHAADLLSALDRTGKSALLIDAKGRVLLASPAAGRLLADTLSLLIEAGVLVAAKACATPVLRRVLNAAQTGNPDSLSLTLARAKGGPVELLAVPISRDAPRAPSSARLLLIISDPEAELAQRQQTFGRHYGLTAAELGIAVEICRGGSRSDVARRRGVSDATVRSQLTAIFDKTGVRRQADLVRLLHAFR